MACQNKKFILLVIIIASLVCTCGLAWFYVSNVSQVGYFSYLGMIFPATLINNTASKSIKELPLNWTCFLPTGTSCHKLFVHLPTEGRLGNQMFGYAATIALSYYHNVTPAISKQSSLRNIFNTIGVVTSEKDAKQWKVKMRNGAACKHDNGTIKAHVSSNAYVIGYFQSYKYFSNRKIIELLKYLFTFKDNIKIKARNIITSAVRTLAASMSCHSHFNGSHYYLSGSCQSHFNGSHYNFSGGVKNVTHLAVIGIHIRRGDLVSQKKISYGYTTAPKDYITRAMLYFSRKFHHVLFIICTDTVSWVKENISQNASVILSEGAETSVDLAILSLCDHVIVTVGSFGWWGAWLSGGEVIYYKNFPKPRSALSRIFSASDYYPPSWIAMT